MEDTLFWATVVVATGVILYKIGWSVGFKEAVRRWTEAGKGRDV